MDSRGSTDCFCEVFRCSWFSQVFGPVTCIHCVLAFNYARDGHLIFIDPTTNRRVTLLLDLHTHLTMPGVAPSPSQPGKLDEQDKGDNSTGPGSSPSNPGGVRHAL